MKKLVLLTLFFCSMNAVAQYYKAKLLMADGTVKEGFAKLPSNQLLDTRVEYKSTENAEEQKIDDDEIYQLLITSEQGTNFLFERNVSIFLAKFLGKEYKQEQKNKNWMLLTHTNEVIRQYTMAQRYRINKDGVMLSITDGSSFWASIYFLFKRPNEEAASIVSSMTHTRGQTRKALAIYFDNYPKFRQRIEEKEFKNESLKEVADAYATYF